MVTRTASALIVLSACASCAIRLDELPQGAPDGAGEPQLFAGCRPLADDSNVVVVTGRLQSLARPNRSPALVAVEVRLAGDTNASTTNVELAVTPAASDVCPGLALSEGEVRTVIRPPSGAPGDRIEAGASVAANEAAWMFYSLYELAPDQPFGVRLAGRGVAAFDSATEAFLPTGELLWTADRPSFGSAALIDDADRAYVYGCAAANLSASCWIARAPVEKLDDPSAYEYHAGGSHWTDDPDDAWPAATAGDPVSVAFHPGLGRYVMGYIPPIGDTIFARSGISPDGPWSKPAIVARCDLPVNDEGAFCYGVSLHPDIGVGARNVVASYAIGTFSAGASDSDPLAYASRIGVLELPDLP